MEVTISPSTLYGNVNAPASKSCMQRACAAALLSRGQTTLINVGHSNDDKAALQIIRDLGAAIISNNDGSITIHSTGVNPATSVINCGESGLSARMFIPIAALSPVPIRIDGIGTLINRPMNIFDEIMPILGVDYKSTNGKLPIQLKGPLQMADLSIDGSDSSQFLTGLLMAYAATNNHIATIKVNNLKSKPYIDLTLDILKAFRLPVPEHSDYSTFTFTPTKKQSLQHHRQFTIEGDWSGAAFLLVAAAISGQITVTKLQIESNQADKKIIEVLQAAQCKMKVTKEDVTVYSSTLQPFTFDATDCPDLFPPLAALAAYCHGQSVIKGLHRLTHKESNRAITLQEELKKLNVDIGLAADCMIIEGGNTIKGAVVHADHDHRIAMACATIALGATTPVTIENAEAVNKSYPDFYHHFEKLGVTIFVK